MQPSSFKKKIVQSLIMPDMIQKCCWFNLFILFVVFSSGTSSVNASTTLLTNGTTLMPCPGNASQNCLYNIMTLSLDSGGALNLGNFTLRNVVSYLAYFPAAVRKCGFCVKNQQASCTCSFSPNSECGTTSCPIYNNTFTEEEEEGGGGAEEEEETNIPSSCSTIIDAENQCSTPLINKANWCFTTELAPPTVTVLTSLYSDPVPIFALGGLAFPITHFNTEIPFIPNATIEVTYFTNSLNITGQDFCPGSGFYSSQLLNMGGMCKKTLPTFKPTDCATNAGTWSPIVCQLPSGTNYPNVWELEETPFGTVIYLINNSEVLNAATPPNAFWVLPSALTPGNFYFFDCCKRSWTSLIKFSNGTILVSGSSTPGAHCAMSNTPATTSNGCSCLNFTSSGELIPCTSFNFQPYIVSQVSQTYYITLTLPITNSKNYANITNPHMNVQITNISMNVTCLNLFPCVMVDGVNNTEFMCSSMPFSYNFEANEPFYSIQCGPYSQMIVNSEYVPSQTGGGFDPSLPTASALEPFPWTVFILLFSLSTACSIIGCGILLIKRNKRPVKEIEKSLPLMNLPPYDMQSLQQ
jgi:hypothetical protein